MKTTEITDFQSEIDADIAKVIDLIREERKASASLFQRKFGWPYGRAVAMVKEMETLGIVSPANGNQPRIIFFDKLEAFQVPAQLSSALTSDAPALGADGKADTQAVLPEPLAASADVFLSATDLAHDPSESATVPPPSSVHVEVGQSLQTVATPGNLPAGDRGFLSETIEQPLRAFNPAIYVYLPPNSGRFNTNAFLENLRRNPPKYPLVTISERAEFNPTIKLKHSPEVKGMTGVIDSGGNTFTIHNLVWIYAMCFAWRDGATHVLYLEEDSRVVGDHWDEAIFNAYLTEQPGALISGTMAAYNPGNTNREFWLRYCQLISKFNTGSRVSEDPKERNFPIATYGWKGSTLPPVAFGNKSQSEKSGSALFVNGAGGIYSMDAFRDLFPEITRWDDKDAKFAFATKTGAWDANIGKRIFDKYRERSFDMVHHNPLVYSVFGNAITTEEERLTMLRSGAVRCVHSVKSEVVA